MPKKYIDANALIEKAKHEADGMAYIDSETFSVVVEWLVDKMPTVDAVKVVRCKDCDSAECSGVMIYCTTHGSYMRDNDFCSYGKRKDGDTDG